jgi:hypothetical protein
MLMQTDGQWFPEPGPPTDNKIENSLLEFQRYLH